jgi:hypothetical protein
MPGPEERQGREPLSGDQRDTLTLDAMHSGSGCLQEEPTYASVFGEAHRPARGCLILLFSESLAMEIRRFCVDEHHGGRES